VKGNHVGPIAEDVITNPCKAFFGPTSTNTRYPASYSVHKRPTNWTGEDLRRQIVHHERRGVSG
jgi:hypothetical protein